MAHLWFEDSQTWTAFPLDVGAIDLSGERPSMSRGGDEGNKTAVLVRDPANSDWVLVVGVLQSVRVNGLPVAGIRVLRDRDEMRIEASGVTVFYSTERLAAIERLSSSVPVFCPRCRQAIPNEGPAVRCPQCGVWHHENESELNCWTYAARCAVCSQPTKLCSAYQWTPEAR